MRYAPAPDRNAGRRQEGRAELISDKIDFAHELEPQLFSMLIPYERAGWSLIYGAIQSSFVYVSLLTALCFNEVGDYRRPARKPCCRESQHASHGI